MSSLRGRLLVGLLGGLLVTALIGAWLIYRTALTEANEVFDEHLRDTALTLRDQTFQQPFFAMVPQPNLSQQDRAADLVVQVFSLDGVRVYLSQAHTIVPGLTTLGYSDVDTTEGRWRVYGVQTPLHVIQVAQPVAVREARAARLALHMLFAFAFLVPALWVLVWVIVGRGLQPLRALATRVEQSSADLLTPLPETGLPDEVRPLVSALNALLGRISGLLDRERNFLADAAHELRTPLTALRLQVQALNMVPEHERQAATAAIGSGMDRASRLIEQLLTLARQQQHAEVPKQTVELDVLARRVIGELLPLADARSIDLGIANAEPLKVDGDIESLAMLLKNLIDNALRYTPSGGRVDVAIFSDDGAANLRVIDNGPGIAPSERGRVFDRFYRVMGADSADKPSGSGLGLAIVKAVAEAHGATVKLQTAPEGHGLMVTVRFPASKA